MTKLTDKGIEKLRVPRGKPVFKWDAACTGLGVKVTPAGRRIFVLQVRRPGARLQTKLTLGAYPGLSLVKARQKADAWREMIRRGEDPAGEERAAELRTHAHTFEAVAERYIAEHLAGQRKERDAAREIRNNLIATWGQRPVAGIKPQDVKELIGDLKARAPYHARNIFGHARTLFAWATHNGLIEVSPCASLKAKWLLSGARLQPRQRVLSDDEIRALWKASGELGYPMGAVYRLLLLTGQRKGEIAGARWREFHPDLRRLIDEHAREDKRVEWRRVRSDVKLLTVPSERFKSGATHLVPMSDDALDLLAAVPTFADCDLVFTTDGKRAVNGFSKSKRRLDELMLKELRERDAKAELPPFVVHDIRRTVRTRLASLRVPDEVAEMVIGHGRRGLQRVYDVHTYEPEMRAALDAWARALRGIVEPKGQPGNVVAMRKKRRA
jgi:integrase